MGETPLWATFCPLNRSLTISLLHGSMSNLASVDTNRSRPTEQSLSHFAKRICGKFIKFIRGSNRDRHGDRAAACGSALTYLEQQTMQRRPHAPDAREFDLPRDFREWRELPQLGLLRRSRFELSRPGACARAAGHWAAAERPRLIRRSSRLIRWHLDCDRP